VVDPRTAAAERRVAREAERAEKKKIKLFKAATRAKKLLAKTEKWMADNGHTWEKLMAMPQTGPGSPYQITAIDAPSAVGNYMSDELSRRHGERSPIFDSDPEAVIAEAEAQGWTPDWTPPSS
jgi:hypothetical protein